MVTDHKALVSFLNGNNKKNKTMFSRLTRWIYRIEHMPWAKIGLADYLSRHPVGKATRVSLYENSFTVAKLQSISNFLGYKGQNTTGVAISKSKTNKNAATLINECNDREGAKKSQINY